MPDKRQESKQRRAARNRANREALAARREAAQAESTRAGSARSGGSSSSASASAASSGGGASRGAANGAAAASVHPAPRSLKDLPRSRRPGDRAVLLALFFAVVAAVYLPFIYRVSVDDRGEPLPVSFRALSVSIRERITGAPLPDASQSLLEASGPSIFALVALPVVVALFAVWGSMRPDRSRMLTFAMLAMAGAVVLTGGVGIFFFPALIALAIGGFRVRKADLPARVAERSTGTGGLFGGGAGGGRGGGGLFGGGGGGGLFGRPRPGGAIDAESKDVTDEPTDAPADDGDELSDRDAGLESEGDDADGPSRRR